METNRDGEEEGRRCTGFNTAGVGVKQLLEDKRGQKNNGETQRQRRKMMRKKNTKITGKTKFRGYIRG